MHTTVDRTHDADALNSRPLFLAVVFNPLPSEQAMTFPIDSHSSSCLVLSHRTGLFVSNKKPTPEPNRTTDILKPA